MRLYLLFSGTLMLLVLQMEIDSVEKLCKFLISSAFQRCRQLDYICRLSVFLKPEPPSVRISVSDTGVGSTLEEFHELKVRNDPILTGKWDGVLSIATTGITDTEIHHMKLDLKENTSSRRLVRLPSAAKNGPKFSGTEVSLSISEKIDVLLAMMTIFIRKMLVLRSPKIAIELSVDSGDITGSQHKRIVLENACSVLPVDAANVDFLKLGFEDYVSKHGNRLVEACQSCSSTGKILKVGTGVACSSGNQQGGGQVMDAVIIISETTVPAQTSCCCLYGRKTEVLYNRDFSPSSMPQSSLDALTSVEWKKYGLTLRSLADQDGLVLLEWENLPPCVHIDIVLHRYNRQKMSSSENSRVDRTLTRKSVKLALKEMKEKNTGVLLSERALKISNYAPDLAKTITGLILSSNDLNFQGQCLSLLGLQCQESNRDTVEKCIKDKLISVISKHDSKSWESREASSLFVDDYSQQKRIGADEEREEGDEVFPYPDF
ncbi:type 2 DNA topoisomerase 6 subunit B-like [Primulina eburnea]|uniref:type 2 DNA topoisomerase 6 subunit B-like n=1 Tax=Primulina eburnea TaxID=1245227 RepID=UPI003C6C064B